MDLDVPPGAVISNFMIQGDPLIGSKTINQADFHVQDTDGIWQFCGTAYFGIVSTESMIAYAMCNAGAGYAA